MKIKDLKLEEIQDIIKRNKEREVRQIRNKDYYYNKFDIRNKKPQGKDHPNNIIPINYVRLTVDTKTDITVGNNLEIYHNCKDDKEKEIELLVNNIFDDNNFTGLKNYIFRDIQLYSESFLYIYQNSKGETKFELIPPYEAIVVYKDKDKKDIDFFIRYYKVERIDTITNQIKTSMVVELIDEEKITYLIEDDGELIPDIERFDDQEYQFKHNIFKQVPIVHFKGDLEEIGRINDIIGLNEAANKTISFLIDKLEKENEYKLMLKNMNIPKGLSKEELDDYMRKVKESEIWWFDEKGDMKYVNPPTNTSINDRLQTLQTIENLIFDLARLPNTNDDKANSNASGTTLKMRNQTMEIETMRNKGIMIDGIIQILNIIKPVVFLKLGKSYDISEFSFNFNITLPHKESETVDNIIKLYNNGLISKQTAIEKIPFFKDPIEELSKIDEEENYEKDDYYQIALNRHKNTKTHN